MRTSTAAYATAQASTEQTIASQVLVNWGPSVTGAPADISALFESITPQADFVTDMPADSRQITGYVARSAQMVLSGALTGDPSLSAMELFDSYSPSSPLYGADWTGAQGATLFTIYEGQANLPGETGPELFPIFSGYCTVMDVNRTTGQVTLTMIDTRVLISTVPQIPEVIAQYPQTIGVIAPGLDSTWALDFLLRSNGVYSSPPPVGGCLFYMSGHGSIWPEIGGSMIAPSSVAVMAAAGGGASPPAFVATGAYGAMDTPGTCTITDTFEANTPISFHAASESANYCHPYFQLAILTTAAANNNIAQFFLTGFAGDAITVTIGQTSSGQVLIHTLSLQRAGGTASISTIATGTATAGWQKVAIQLSFTSTASITGTVWVNGTATPFTLSGTPGAYSGDLTQVSLTALTPIDTFQISSTFAGPPPAFTPTAFLDQSLNPLIAIPAYTNADPWSLITDICEAEFATNTFDELQIFYFRNRHNVATVPQVTLKAIKDLQYEVNESTRAQEVISPVHPVGVVGPQIVYTQTGQVTLPANSETIVTCLCPQPVSAVAGGVNFIPVGGITTFGSSWIMVNSKPDGTGAAITTGIVAEVIQVSATVAQLFIINTNAFAVYLAPTSGYDSTNGVLAICGLAVIDNAASGNGVQTSASYGGGIPSLTLPDNIWRQYIPAVTTMVQDELSDMVRPRAIITSLTIIGDARLQLGDRARIVDAGELANSSSIATLPAAINDDFIIVSIHPQIDSNGFVQVIVARAIASARQWVLGQIGKSELGATTWI